MKYQNFFEFNERTFLPLFYLNITNMKLCTLFCKDRINEMPRGAWALRRSINQLLTYRTNN